MRRFGLVFVSTLFLLAGCVSAPKSSPPAQAPAAEPPWVTAPGSVYNQNAYLAAVGHGSSREMAEKNALAALAAVFGQTIEGDLTISEAYSEAVQQGAAAAWTQNTSVENTIKTSVSMDIIGAEIKDVWFDTQSTYYAVAVMDKAKTTVLYRDLVKANQEMLANLTAMSAEDKNTFAGFSRYQLAATIADANTVFANVLSVIDKAPSGLKKGDDYRLEAASIAKNMPILVRVAGDRAGRLQAAFSSVFASLGFASGGNNSRYVLDAVYTSSEAQFANQTAKYIRYELDASLTDTKTKTVLVPFNINGRAGHGTLSEAQNRAFSAAEGEINASYSKTMSEYLSGLLPKK